jgi:hypothetical protein
MGRSGGSSTEQSVFILSESQNNCQQSYLMLEHEEEQRGMQQPTVKTNGSHVRAAAAGEIKDPYKVRCSRTRGKLLGKECHVAEASVTLHPPIRLAVVLHVVQRLCHVIVTIVTESAAELTSG